MSRDNEKTGFGDEMTIDSRTGNIRAKYVHQQGVVSKVKYVPHPKNVLARGYTGIFKSGANDAIVRFSDASQHLAGTSDSINPSFGVKFLRSGQISGNMLGQVSFESEAGNMDFWKNDFKSKLPVFAEHDSQENVCLDEDGAAVFNASKLVKEECGPLSVGRWMAQVGKRHQFINGHVDLASFDQDGIHPVPYEEWPKYPFDLEFVPNREILAPTDGTDRFYK